MYINNLYSLYHLTRRVFDKASSLPSDIACKVHSADWFEQSVLLPQYQQQLTQHKEHLPNLDLNEQTIVEQIEQNGTCITSLDTLAIPNSQQLLDSAQQIVAELTQKSRSPHHAHKHTLMATAHQVMTHPEIFFWGVSERILKIVECYLGLPVAYDGLSFYYSLADGRDAGPRLWHRDKEDWKMIKVAIYLNDVDELGGPYQCIKPHINRQLIAMLPQYKRLSHAELELVLSTLNATDSDWLTSCTGKAGTVIFTDTARCYHRGKPPLKTARSAIFFHYFSQCPKNPFYCDRSFLSRQQTSTLTRQLPVHLQKHISWREQLTGISRYIPPNRTRVEG